MAQMRELKEWAEEHNYMGQYKDYVKEREQISVDCMRDGLAPYGYDFELRDEALKNFYSEIFQDKEVITGREESLKLADVLIKNDGVIDITRSLSEFYNNHAPNEPYLWEDTQKVIYEAMEEKLNSLGELPNLYFNEDTVSDIVDAMEAILNKEDLSIQETKFQLLNINLDADIQLPAYHDTGAIEAEKYMTDMINKSTKYDSILEVSLDMQAHKDDIEKLIVATTASIAKSKEKYEELCRPLEERIRDSINVVKYPEYGRLSMTMYKIYKDIHLEPDKLPEDILPCESLQEQYDMECERIARECQEQELDNYDDRVAKLYNEPRFEPLKNSEAEEMYVGLDPEALLEMAMKSPVYSAYESLFKTMLDQEPERERRHMPEYEYDDIEALYYASQDEILSANISEYLLSEDIAQSIGQDIRSGIEESIGYNYDVRDTNYDKDISMDEEIEFDGDMDIDEIEIFGSGARDIRDFNGDGIIDTDEMDFAGDKEDKEREEELEFEL